MGFFDDDDLELDELLDAVKKYPPCVAELTEANVQAIFNRCLATKDTPNADVQLSVLFKKVMGYDKDSDPMAFCKSKIEQNKKNILYLMGQLDSVHRGSRDITAKESIFRYDGKQWATTNAVIGELYHLAEAVDGIYPFVQKLRFHPEYHRQSGMQIRDFEQIGL